MLFPHFFRFSFGVYFIFKFQFQIFFQIKTKFQITTNFLLDRSGETIQKNHLKKQYFSANFIFFPPFFQVSCQYFLPLVIISFVCAKNDSSNFTSVSGKRISFSLVRNSYIFSPSTLVSVGRRKRSQCDCVCGYTLHHSFENVSFSL